MKLDKQWKQGGRAFFSVFAIAVMLSMGLASPAGYAQPAGEDQARDEFPNCKPGRSGEFYEQFCAEPSLGFGAGNQCLDCTKLPVGHCSADTLVGELVGGPAQIYGGIGLSDSFDKIPYGDNVCGENQRLTAMCPEGYAVRHVTELGMTREDIDTSCVNEQATSYPRAARLDGCQTNDPEFVQYLCAAVDEAGELILLDDRPVILFGGP